MSLELEIHAMLDSGLLAMDVNLTDEQLKQLCQYVLLIHKWNKVYNLTAIRDPLEMVKMHILDSISVLHVVQQLSPRTLLDVGAGAGLPSIPLAIGLPALQVMAIDSVKKKESFMRQVKGELGLKNFNVHTGRVEALTCEKLGFNGGVDVVISRAFSEIALMMKLTKHLLREKGVWLAMKGVVPVHEFDATPIEPTEIIKLKVATLDAERHLIVYDN